MSTRRMIRNQKCENLLGHRRRPPGGVCLSGRDREPRQSSSETLRLVVQLSGLRCVVVAYVVIVVVVVFVVIVVERNPLAEVHLSKKYSRASSE